MNWMIVGPLGGLVWFVFCRFIYRPGGFKPWVGVWLKTGCALLVMFGIAELLEDASQEMMRRMFVDKPQGNPWWMVAFQIGLLGAFFFTWCTLLRDDKVRVGYRQDEGIASIGNSYRDRHSHGLCGLAHCGNGSCIEQRQVFEKDF